VDIGSRAKESFRAPGGESVTVDHPICKAALVCLHESAAQSRVLVIATGRYDASWSRPGSVVVVHRDIVAGRRAMKLGRELEANDAPGCDVDDHAMQHRTTESPGSGYFHALSVGCPTFVSTVHLADFPLVLLLRRDLFRVRRPKQNRALMLAQPALSVA
jgi:hypothetical protein